MEGGLAGRNEEVHQKWLASDLAEQAPAKFGPRAGRWNEHYTSFIVTYSPATNQVHTNP